MYKRKKVTATSISINTSYEAESIEEKITRAINNKEPITDAPAPKIFTERKDGVLPAYNPRTDRFDVAIDGMETIRNEKIAQREARMKLGEEARQNMEKEQKSEGGAQSTPGTDTSGDVTGK